jgi:hypothetical protein
VIVLLFPFKTHPKTLKTLKIWLRYHKISKISVKNVDLPEYYYKYVNY